VADQAVYVLIEAGEHLFTRQLVVTCVTEQVEKPVYRGIVEGHSDAWLGRSGALLEMSNGIDHA
jgi:hypothetical protein